MHSTNNERQAHRWVAVAVAVAGCLAAAAAAAPAASAQPAEVTFTKDIAPILQRSCQSCHRPGPGGGAPMSLLTYNDVRPWARAIRARTSERTMPPWFIEKDVGVQEFKDDPSLSDAEIALIGRWVDAGAPRGNPADLPPPRQFPDGKEWTIGEPDLIVSSPEKVIEAVAADWHGYWESTPVGLAEDRYVQAVEVHEVRVSGGMAKAEGLGGYSVIHHAGIMAGTPGEGVAAGPVNPTDGGFMMTHEAGQNATRYTDGLGVNLPADSSLHWRVHTHSFGEEVTARLDVGFKFHPAGYEPKYTAPGPGVFLTFNDLDIPAGCEGPALRRAGRNEEPVEAGDLRAAHARGGHADVPERAVSGRGARDADLRGVRPQLGQGVQLRRPRRAAAAGGDHPACDRVVRQLGREPQHHRAAQLARPGQPLDGRHVLLPRPLRRPDRGAVRGRAGRAAAALATVRAGQLKQA